MKTAKTFLMKYGGAVLSLTCAGSLVFSAATDAPRPAVATAAPAIGEPYKVLLTRSIFSRDGRAAEIRPRSRSERTGSPSTTQSTTAPSSAPNPEASLVLRGVGMQDGVFTAFFEETIENKGLSRRVGDKVARGQILAMTLDGVDYISPGHATSHIQIGQALDGRIVDASHVAGSSPAATGDWRSRWHHADAPATPGAAPAASQGEAQYGFDRFRREGRAGEQPQQPGANGSEGRPPEEGAAPGAAPTTQPQPSNDGPPPFEFFDPN